MSGYPHPDDPADHFSSAGWKSEIQYPACTFGPYVLDFLLGGSNLWAFFPIYIIGPVIGAVGSALFYDRITADQQ